MSWAAGSRWLDYPDERALLEAVAQAYEENPRRGEELATVLEELDRGGAPSAILHDSAPHAATLAKLYREARDQGTVPQRITRLWTKPNAEPGIAYFPAGLEGEGRVLQFVVSEGAGGREARVDEAFRSAVEAAQREVLQLLPECERLLGQSHWSIGFAPEPIEGGSVFLAAAVATASFLCGDPVKPGWAFSAERGQGRALSPVGQMQGKLVALGRYECALKLAVAEAQPDKDSNVHGFRSLEEVLDRVLGPRWHQIRGLMRGISSSAMSPDEEEIRARAEALLHRFGPLDETTLTDCIYQDDPWSSGAPTGRPVGKLLEQGALAVRLDAHHWLGLSSPLPSYVKQAERCRPEPADPCLDLREAWSSLQDLPNPRAHIERLARHERSDTLRLALAIACQLGPAALRDQTEVLTRPTDPRDAWLAIQATVEAALHWIAALALEEAEAGRLELDGAPSARHIERPSAGSLREIVEAASKSQSGESASLMREALAAWRALGVKEASLLNRALHHPEGWERFKARKQLDDPLTLPLLRSGLALLDACSKLKARWPEPRAVRRVREEHLFPRGRGRAWGFSRGGVLRGDEEALERPTPPARPTTALAYGALPRPLAAALRRLQAAHEPYDRVSATVSAVNAGLRLIAFARLAERASTTHPLEKTPTWLARCIRRSLLEQIAASPGPWEGALAEQHPHLKALIEHLERLEHHPGPLAAAPRLVETVAALALAALPPLFEGWSLIQRRGAGYVTLDAPAGGALEAPLTDEIALDEGELALKHGEIIQRLGPFALTDTQDRVWLLAEVERSKRALYKCQRARAFTVIPHARLPEPLPLRWGRDEGRFLETASDFEGDCP